MIIDIRQYNGYDDVVFIGDERLKGQPLNNELEVTDDSITFNLFLDERLPYYNEVSEKLRDIRHKIKSIKVISRPPDDVRTVRLSVNNDFLSKQQDIPEDIQKVINEKFWDLI